MDRNYLDIPDILLSNDQDNSVVVVGVIERLRDHMEREMKAPDNYVVLLRRAREQVEASPLYRRFISGTPLENDIAVWMATFAAEIRIESMPNPEELADLRARLDAAEQKYIELRGMLKVIAMDKDRSERTEIIYEVLNRHDNTNPKIQ